MRQFILLVMFIISATTRAYDVEIDGIYYNIKIPKAKIAEVTRGDIKYSGSISVPSSIQYDGDTYLVGGIGTQAFYNCSGLTSVTIPSSITSIGSNAFSGCSGLSKVIVPDIVGWCGISFTGNNSNPLFYARHLYSDENTEITELIIPNSVTNIGNYAFDECSGLTSVNIPNSVTSIGNGAFSYCSGLTSVNIPNSVTSIGNGAFSGCSGLTSVNIPNSVTSIGHSAFYNCSGLTSVTIGNSVTSIGYSAFANCSGLSKVIIHDIASWCSIDFSNNLNDQTSNPLYYAHHLYSDENTEITELIIPSSVTSIGVYTFYNCSGLTSVTIPSSITSIGSNAFSGCSGLSKVIVPDIVGWCGISFTDYNSNPLFYARHLYSDENTEITELIIPNSVTNIGNYAFYGCSGLTSVNIPNSVTSIGSDAFYGCSGLTSVNIGNSVTSIGSSAFYGCSGLTSVNIGNSVTSIDSYAFYGCKELLDIYCYAQNLPTTVSSITGYSIFYNSYIEYATLHVPASAIEAYKTTSPWSEFGTFVAIGDYEQQVGPKIETIGGITYIIDADTKEAIVTDVEANKSIIVPESIECDGEEYTIVSIAADAFKRCSSTTTLYITLAKPLPITTDALNGLIKDSCTLYVPKGSILAYARATGWKDFVNIVEVDNDIPQDVNNDGIVDSQDVLEIYNYMQNQ